MVIRLLLAAVVAVLPVTAHAAAVSAWARGDHAALRIVAAPSRDGTLQAGLEIRLDPGWQTYWKAPGESGVPPQFDWSASKNLAAIAVAWPAPRRFDEAGDVTFGYHDELILPLRVTPAQAGPVTLGLDVHYAVCAQVCIPAEANVSLVLGDGSRPDAFAAARLAGFAAQVPQPATVGAAGPLAITAVRREKHEGKYILAVTVRTPADAAGVALFAAGGPVGVPRPAPDGTWRVPLVDASTGAAELVLAAGGSAISVAIALDALPATP